MEYWGLTDAGCVRSQNQDAYQVEMLDRSTVLCVLCDGMGGAKSGNVASSLAVDVFTQEVRRSWSSSMDEAAVEEMLRNTVKLANYTVYDQAKQFEEFEGMGTTMVAALIHGKSVVMINVGDSRGYRVSNKGIRQITTDHSLVQMMVQRGELTPEQAKHYPGKNLITRAIGTEATVQCDVFSFRGEPGDCLLLCSDGLSNMIDEQEILFEVWHEPQKAECCKRLLEIAKNRGAPDNVTSVLVQL